MPLIISDKRGVQLFFQMLIVEFKANWAEPIKKYGSHQCVYRVVHVLCKFVVAQFSHDFRYESFNVNALCFYSVNNRFFFWTLNHDVFLYKINTKIELWSFIFRQRSKNYENPTIATLYYTSTWIHTEYK